MVLGWMAACIVIDFVVIVANVVEQILIIRKWSSLDRIEHLLLSLSISDLISGFTMMVIDTWMVYRFIHYGMADMATSNVIVILDTTLDAIFLFSIFASIFHVIAVAIERLYAIKFPRKYHIFTTFKLKCGTIAIVWILSLSLTITFSMLSVFSIENEVGVYIRGCVFAASAALVFLTYVYIAYLLLRQRQNVLQNFSPENGTQDHRLKRLTVLCLFIGISFDVCILPITMSYFNPELYHHISNLMITLNSLINPCVYFMKVLYERRQRQATRQRSDTTNALLDARNSCATATTDVINETRQYEKNEHLC